ncbi:hypothetical protein WCD74_21270 [Actinomycetospora sp. OC33-EN08]|uniref:Uncharacterized protein n=1 Tax=Actinomycetospora aurantiaca TaxID=3129233 RepID=A0ABU8MTM1_9PSEU
MSAGAGDPLFSGENTMGRHHTADQLVDSAVAAAVIPAPRRSPEDTPAPVVVPQPRGWRARRAAKADAAAARAQAVAVAHAQRRARQVALASLGD